jgi:pimeloyl-ACP methyl ester carboxylesterase
VVVVHGAFDGPQQWRPVAERLAGRSSFFLLQRRSWMGPPSTAGGDIYALERADIAQLLKIAGPRAALLGHSAGGALAADYARRTALPGRLVLFDPALPLGGPVSGRQLPAMRQLVRQGRNEAAFRLFLQSILQKPRADVDAFARDPDFKRQAALTPNLLRELAALDALPRSPSAYAAIKAPTWIILGEKSPEHPFHDTARALAKALPHAQVRPLKGQGHMGMVDAPDQFAKVLESCLTGA